ncbi:MAG: DUF4197 domain-containing protein [Prolixibacteraceae bacterium]
MKKIYLLYLVLFGLVLSSCEILLKTANTMVQTNVPLTKNDIAQGLKQALGVSVDTAVFRLNRKDAYFLDQFIKLQLPAETNEVLEYARKIPGLDQKLDEFILQINRSAEDAAASAAPIFKQAILSMNIDDVLAILNGQDNAATQYLQEKTYNQLVELYRPILAQSLKKPFAAGVSADQTWTEITNQWNKFANSFAGDLLKVDPINIQLDEYFTSKALDGVFIKVADQEKEIRNNANARVTDLMKRVFEKK